MRIRLGKSIYSCTKVTHLEKSTLLIITTSNGLYTVDMVTVEKAEAAYIQLLVKGYYDASTYEYCN